MPFLDALRSAGFTFIALMAVASVITVTNGAPGEIVRRHVANTNLNDATARLTRAARNTNGKHKQHDHCLVEKGYVLYNNRCLKLYTIAEDYMTAEKHCEADKTHLFDMKSPEKDVPALQSLLRTAGNEFPLGSEGLWVGATDLLSENIFVWSDGSSLQTNFALWVKGQPDNYQSNENCVEVFPSTFSLNDNVCTARLGYVCQADIKTK